ncbi:MAG TPA: hypothetical protein DD649_15465 [Providencia sp.]|uniref:hypothetical protein n=1 Tax=Providencia sp. TaxID=589 RepID=UPI000E9E0688|nr:hypothetical protein [Providencia sp.]
MMIRVMRMKFLAGMLLSIPLSAVGEVSVTVFNSVDASSQSSFLLIKGDGVAWWDYCAEEPTSGGWSTCWAPGSDSRTRGADMQPTINYVTGNDPISKIEGACTVYFQPYYEFGGMHVKYKSAQPEGWSSSPGGFGGALMYSLNFSNCQTVVGGGRYTFPYIRDYKFVSFPQKVNRTKSLCYNMYINANGKNYPLIDGCKPIDDGTATPTPTPVSCSFDLPSVVEHGVVNKNEPSLVTVPSHFQCSKTASVSFLFSGFQSTSASGGAVYEFDSSKTKTTMCIKKKGSTSCNGGSNALVINASSGDIIITSELDSSLSESGSFSLSAPLIVSYN